MTEKSKNYARRIEINEENRKRLLKLNPSLNDEGGIYFFLRRENGFRYAYIGQTKESVGILNRLCQHLVGHTQWIDVSLKKHKLYDEEKNPTGWRVEYLNFPDEELDKWEQYYIKQYANAGFQMRNVSQGGQGEGRSMINDTKERKGYRQGVEHGKQSLAKQISEIIDKHLIVSIKPEKLGNKVSQKQFEKFKELLSYEQTQDNTKE